MKKIEIFINHQLIKIIYLRQDLKLAEAALLNEIWVTGDGLAACSATKHDLDDRETISDQGGSVVPDGMTAHEIERPETH